MSSPHHSPDFERQVHDKLPDLLPAMPDPLPQADDPVADVMRHLYLVSLVQEGKNRTQIAQITGLSYSCVTKRLYEAYKQGLSRLSHWVKSVKFEIDLQLQKIISESFEAWEKSKSPHKRVVKKIQRNEKGEEEAGQMIQEVEDCHGDIRYLDRAQAAIDKRAKLWNIESPTKIALTNARGKDLPPQSLDERAATLRAIHEEMSKWKPGKMSKDELVPPEKVEGSDDTE